MINIDLNVFKIIKFLIKFPYFKSYEFTLNLNNRDCYIIITINANNSILQIEKIQIVLDKLA